MIIHRDSSGTASNIVMEFANDVKLSIGVSGQHYVAPHGHQAVLNRQAVEMAVFKGNEFATKEFFSCVMGEIHYYSIKKFVPVSELFEIISKLDEWARKGARVEIDPIKVKEMYDKHEEKGN